MTDYRTLFDKENLGAWDLGGRECVVTIETVKPGEVGGHQGKKKERKPIITFKGKRKKFVCNVTNAATIAGLYGPHVEKWIGKRIVIYPTTTTFGRETVDCIRVRPVVPGASKPDTEDALDRDLNEAMRAKQDAAAGRTDELGSPDSYEDAPNG
jgi:hypothetical protein